MQIGMIGLGRMGANMVRRLQKSGHPCVVYDRSAEAVNTLAKEGMTGAQSTADFVSKLSTPRVVWLMLPAAVVDASIAELTPLLAPGDIIIDGGNSYYKDDIARAKRLATKSIHYADVGVSGGTWGLERGYCLMIGAQPQTYAHLQPIFASLAPGVATAPRTEGASGTPSTAEEGYLHCGPEGAGHFVKMVHNGIEYGLMELIGETYDLLNRGLGLTPAELAPLYDRWNREELNSFLVSITAKILARRDDRTGKPLIDMILDKARQKGTGMWTSWDAMDLRVGTPTIDAAVVMRDMSGYKEERRAAAQFLTGPTPAFPGDRQRCLGQVKNALYAGMIATYAQGMALLQKASSVYGYGLDLEAVARIWRGGCIIRAALLEDIRTAYRARADLPNLLMDPRLGKEFLSREADLREVVKVAVTLGLPAPGLMVTLSYFDAYRSAVLPANLIQAQRDFFGAHTYERLDAPGAFHTQWEEE